MRICEVRSGRFFCEVASSPIIASNRIIDGTETRLEYFIKMYYLSRNADRDRDGDGDVFSRPLVGDPMKSLFLVLEGGDGSGKSSQIALLDAFFKKSSRKVRTVHFPRLDSKPYGVMVAEFLRGEYGPLESVHPKLAALVYALDRQQMAAELKDFLSTGGTLICDRYIFSNIAYQCAKLADPAGQDALSDWIEKLEYVSHGIPRPDLTLYLDVPPEFARANLQAARKGADRDYLAGGRDIHEADDGLQARVREQFRRLAKARTGEIGLVDCRGADGGIADRQTIHSRILDALRYYGVISR